jgi:hypothetical protein
MNLHRVFKGASVAGLVLGLSVAANDAKAGTVSLQVPGSQVNVGNAAQFYTGIEGASGEAHGPAISSAQDILPGGGYDIFLDFDMDAYVDQGSGIVHDVLDVRMINTQDGSTVTLKNLDLDVFRVSDTGPDFISVVERNGFTGQSTSEPNSFDLDLAFRNLDGLSLEGDVFDVGETIDVSKILDALDSEELSLPRFFDMTLTGYGTGADVFTVADGVDYPAGNGLYDIPVSGVFGNNVHLSGPEPNASVPEPFSVMMLGGALLALSAGAGRKSGAQKRAAQEAAKTSAPGPAIG